MVLLTDEPPRVETAGLHVGTRLKPARVQVAGSTRALRVTAQQR